MITEASHELKKFLELARVLRATREREFAPSVEPEDALAEVDDFVTMLKCNFVDSDSLEAKLENAAGALASILSLADLLMAQMPMEQLDRLIAANKESEEA